MFGGDELQYTPSLAPLESSGATSYWTVRRKIGNLGVLRSIGGSWRMSWEFLAPSARALEPPLLFTVGHEFLHGAWWLRAKVVAGIRWPTTHGGCGADCWDLSSDRVCHPCAPTRVVQKMTGAASTRSTSALL